MTLMQGLQLRRSILLAQGWLKERHVDDLLLLTPREREELLEYLVAKLQSGFNYWLIRDPDGMYYAIDRMFQDLVNMHIVEFLQHAECYYTTEIAQEAMNMLEGSGVDGEVEGLDASIRVDATGEY